MWQATRLGQIVVIHKLGVHLVNMTQLISFSLYTYLLSGSGQGFSQNSTKAASQSWADKPQDRNTVDWSGIVENVFKEEIGKYAADLNTQTQRK